MFCMFFFFFFAEVCVVFEILRMPVYVNLYLSSGQHETAKTVIFHLKSGKFLIFGKV